MALTDGQLCIKPGSPEWRVMYETYLTSPRWEATKRRYYAQTGRHACAACGSTDQVQLHHKTYERLGHELLGDLTPLCEPCHAGVHEIHRQKQPAMTLAQVTDLVCSPNKNQALTSITWPKDEAPPFVPARLRNAHLGEDGKLHATGDWRDECRTLPRHPTTAPRQQQQRATAETAGT
jgi:hypothetical protein